MQNQKDLERSTREGDSPVWVINVKDSGILSRAGHVKSCLNLGGPPSKAKYEQMTDSAEVP